MKMKDALYVPSLKKNPLSILALKERGHRVAFVDGQFLMWPKGKTIDDVVVIGEQEGGLYKLKGHPKQTFIHDIVEPNEIWHRRLAHVHYRALPLARKVVEGLLEIQAKHEGNLKEGDNLSLCFQNGLSSLLLFWINQIFIKYL